MARRTSLPYAAFLRAYHPRLKTVSSGADFFGRALAAQNKPAEAGTGTKLKELQCAAMWAGWRLLEVVPGGFAFVSIENEVDRIPLTGSMAPEQVERFIHARERERRMW